MSPLLVAGSFFIGIIIAIIVPFTPSTDSEKGTLAEGYTEERARFVQIDRSIKIVPEKFIFIPEPTITPTPSPTQIPTPIPTPIKTPVPVTRNYSQAPEIIFDAICNQGLGWNCQEALNIAWCESRWEPWRYNPSGATGLFQIMLPLHAEYFEGDPYNPYINARAAFILYSQRFNWSAWACYPY